MKILIGADIVPTGTNENYFENAQMEQILEKPLYDLIKSVDYRIFNLEVPLTDKETPIQKCGPNLIASTKAIAGLKELGIDFLTLANNHILDQGEQGLRSTVDLLDKAEIAYGGVGDSPEEAAQPHFVQLDGKVIGIYCCAEHEFSIVRDKHAGANPFDPLESLDHIAELKKQCEYVICLYHGGKEHYRYPSPGLQKTCRKIVEKGADLVICQHSHCIGCEEKWQNGTIVYGQGNFLFDHSENEFWQTSVLVQLDLIDFTISYIPILKNGNGVKLADADIAQNIISDMQTRSKQILKQNFIEEEYASFAKAMINSYFLRDSILMHALPLRILNKLSGNLISRCLARQRIKRYRLTYINQYECEAHRELILKALSDKL